LPCGPAKRGANKAFEAAPQATRAERSANAPHRPWANLRHKLDVALPGKNELLARFEHALAMEMIHILGKRG
jgi:hypothetical protein